MARLALHFPLKRGAWRQLITHTGRTTGSGEAVPLVGRERELAELDVALVDARAGRGRVFLIAGEPGIGKTRLVEAVAAHGVEQGMLALWGRAWESAGAPAYWPWTQVLRSLIGTRDVDALESELGPGVSWLAQVLPELTECVPADNPQAAPDSEKARFALFDAVASFLREAAASDPLVIVIDDLHAADPASLLLLEFVAHGVPQAAILLLATFQEAAARQRPQVEKLIGALGRESQTIVLRGLGEDELGRIVEHRTGQRWPPELLSNLRETTEGNPFFTTEVARLLVAEGGRFALDERTRFPLPDTVRETVRRRFEPLDPRTLQLLETAAVIGREFLLATLKRAAGHEEWSG